MHLKHQTEAQAVLSDSKDLPKSVKAHEVHVVATSLQLFLNA